LNEKRRREVIRAGKKKALDISDEASLSPLEDEVPKSLTLRLSTITKQRDISPLNLPDQEISPSRTHRSSKYQSSQPLYSIAPSSPQQQSTSRSERSLSHPQQQSTSRSERSPSHPQQQSNSRSERSPSLLPVPRTPTAPALSDTELELDNLHPLPTSLESYDSDATNGWSDRDSSNFQALPGYFKIEPPTSRIHRTYLDVIDECHISSLQNGYDLSLTGNGTKKNSAGEICLKRIACTQRGETQNNRKIISTLKSRSKRKTGCKGCMMGVILKAVDIDDVSGPWAISYGRGDSSWIHTHGPLPPRVFPHHRTRHLRTHLTDTIQSHTSSGISVQRSISAIYEENPDSLVVAKDIRNQRTKVT
jgi:hypothetical protein